MREIVTRAVRIAMAIGIDAFGPIPTVQATISMRETYALKNAPGTAASMAPTASAMEISGKRVSTKIPATPPAGSQSQ